MADFTFKVSSNIMLGSYTASRVGQFALEYGTRAMLIIDPILKENGIADKIKQSLSDRNVEFFVFDELSEGDNTDEEFLEDDFFKDDFEGDEFFQIQISDKQVFNLENTTNTDDTEEDDSATIEIQETEAEEIIEKYNGNVPSEMEELTSLPGVGRKTANVVMAEAFKMPAIAVDTHVLRVSNRIGFIKSDDPQKVELKLRKIIPIEKWSRAHQLLIFHGRYICHARKPECYNCKIQEYCKAWREKCF